MQFSLQYSRQLIFWTIPIALSGQRYDASTKALTFNPKPGYDTQWPILLPSGTGIITQLRECYRFQVLFGSLEASSITISRERLALTDGLKSIAGDTKILCSNTYKPAKE